jgi:RNA polymerase sigma-54 factor
MLRQSLSQKMLQKLSPQQIQLMKLIQLPMVALEQRIKEELEENPALEEGTETEAIENEDFGASDDFQDNFDFDDYMSDDDTPSYKLYTAGSGNDAMESSIPFAAGKSFHDLLKAQLDLLVLNEEEQVIAEVLIGNLDEAGYLRREIFSIVDDLAFSHNVETTEEEILTVLHLIQSFDPAGIGCRSLQECLLLQLDRILHPTEGVKIAKEILQNQFDAFTKKHYERITDKLGITDDDLKDAIDEILKLNPKPGNDLNESVKQIEQIIPDFIVSVHNGKLDFQINNRNIPELNLNNRYLEMFESFSEKKGRNSEDEKKAVLFVKQKLDSAKWFIDAIKQRQHTLLLTMDALMHYQSEYFLTGDETTLKPMILKDLAEKVNLDISTISRVVNSKYVQTPYGTFLLKTFFSEGYITESGEEVSTREIKKILQDLIEAENKQHPINDDKLAEELKEKGYNIARRTVAKYREQLNIPVARLRKVL